MKIAELKHDFLKKEYSIMVDGNKAFITYDLAKGRMRLLHSEVPPNLRGQGVGEILVEKTFEKLMEEGHKAVAVCSYIRLIAMRSDKWSNVIEF